MRNDFSINKIALYCSAIFVYIFIWTPVLVLVFYSFNSSKISIGWEGATLKWYSWVLNNPQVLRAFFLSFIVSIVTVIINVPLGALTAYGLFKYKFKGKSALRYVILLPILVPEVILGGALLLYFRQFIGIRLGYFTVIAAHILYTLPLATFILLSRMQRINWSLEEASMDLGANWPKTIRKVIIPQLMPGIIGSIMIVFPWSYNNFVLTYFVAGLGGTTLPVYVFGMMRTGINPGINAIGSLVIFGMIFIILSISWLQKRINQS